MSRFRSVRAAALAAVCAAVAFAPVTRATSLPGDDDVQRLLDAKDYAGAEAALDRLLACRGAAAEHNDRSRDYQMLAECQLQLNQPVRLAKTLKAAVEKAEADSDPAALAAVAPLELLRRAAIDGVYRPRADRKARYDLSDPDQRKAAEPLVYAEALAAVTESWRAARGKRDLAPVVGLAGTFALVRATEQSLTGATAQTDDLGRDVERSVAAIVGQRLATLAKEVANARKTAGQVVNQPVLGGNGRMQVVGRKRGLSEAELQGLRGVADTCDKLNAQVEAINRGLAAPLQLGGSEPTADDVKQQATDLLSDLGAL